MQPEQLRPQHHKRQIKMALGIEIKDAEKGIVEAVLATFNVKDLHDDFTLPEAFENGAAVLISAYNHTSWWDAIPVGKGTIRVEPTRAVLVGQFNLATEAGREHFEMVKFTGDLQQWSYGYDVLETGEVTEALRQTGVRRVLKKLKVWEGSPVIVGAGVDTETLSVKRHGRKTAADATEPAFEVGAAVTSAVDRIEGMMGRSGTITEARAGAPPYYAVTFDEPIGMANPYRWLAEDEIAAAVEVEATDEPADDSASKSAIRKELARFEQTRARLVG